jgi:hypothetical protein
MRATDFEYRHQTLLHLLVVGIAFLTYVIEPNDVVWALVKHHGTDRALWEHTVFGIGAMLVVLSAWLATWADAYRNRAAADVGLDFLSHIGRVYFAVGIGLLAPALGSAILLTGEIILTLRLFGRLNVNWERISNVLRRVVSNSFGERSLGNWATALRKQISKWGLGITMIVFTLTLKDRTAEIMAGASFLAWALINAPDFLRSCRSRAAA